MSSRYTQVYRSTTHSKRLPRSSTIIIGKMRFWKDCTSSCGSTTSSLATRCGTKPLGLQWELRLRQLLLHCILHTLRHSSHQSSKHPLCISVDTLTMD